MRGEVVGPKLLQALRSDPLRVDRDRGVEETAVDAEVVVAAAVGVVVVVVASRTRQVAQMYPRSC